jgi:hypothetical protein
VTAVLYWNYLGREGYLYPVPYVEYFSDGRIRVEGFHMRERNDGEWFKQGPITVYYPNGNKSSEGRHNYGREAGTWKYWNEDGTIRCISEKNDSRDNFVQTGELMERETTFENGVAKIIHESWCERGQRTTWLNSDGTPSKVEELDDANHVKQVTVYENGVARVLPPQEEKGLNKGRREGKE